MNTNTTRKPHLFISALLLLVSVVLSSCTGTGLKQPPRSLIIAQPQIIYRIDESRYFILKSNGEQECNNGTIVYIDDNLHIKANVESWSQSRLWPRKFTIDAANTQYLGAPTEGSSGNCSSGSGNCFGNAAVFSSDYGKTWMKRQQGSDENIAIVGNEFYEYKSNEIEGNYSGRAIGGYFDMTRPDDTEPYSWVQFREPGTPWALSDFGMKSVPEHPSTGQEQSLAKLAVLQNSNPRKIATAPQPVKSPLENSFHCVQKPIINHD